MIILFGLGAGIIVFLLECKFTKTKGVVMSEKATQKAEAPVTSEMVIFGGISIYNIQLISAKLLHIIKHIFTVMETESGLFSLVMDGSGKPIQGKEPVMAMLYPDSKSAVFNLLFHFAEAQSIVTKDTKNRMSLRAVLWYNTLISIFHEIHHSKLVIASNEAIKWTDELEEEATEYARGRIIELGKTCLVEMPTNEEEPLFQMGLIEWRANLETTKSKAKYVASQKRMYDKNIVCSTKLGDGETVDINSFKEFLRQSLDKKEERDDPAWDTKTTSIFVHQPDIVSPDGTLVLEKQEIKTPDSIQEAIEGGDYDDGDTGPSEDPDGVDDTPPANVYQPAASPQTALVTPSGQAWVNPVTANIGAEGVITPEAGQPANTTTAPEAAPALDIPVVEILAIVKAVYMRIYTHVFTKCGFNPIAPTSFDNPDAVYEPIHIGDIPNANKIFLGMDITDAAGARQDKVQVLDQIKGQRFKKSGLPGYWLWLNVNGFKMKRCLVPQNPNKMKSDGSPTSMAGRVRQGWAVMWVIADGINGAESEMKAKIETQPGGATTYTENPFKN